jgi:hypothetical protein
MRRTHEDVLLANDIWAEAPILTAELCILAAQVPPAQTFSEVSLSEGSSVGAAQGLDFS